MKTLLVITFCLFSSVASAQTNCLQTAREVSPQLSAEARTNFETKLNEARELFEQTIGALANAVDALETANRAHVDAFVIGNDEVLAFDDLVVAIGA